MVSRSTILSIVPGAAGDGVETSRAVSSVRVDGAILLQRQLFESARSDRRHADEFSLRRSSNIASAMLKPDRSAASSARPPDVSALELIAHGARHADQRAFHQAGKLHLAVALDAAAAGGHDHISGRVSDAAVILSITLPSVTSWYDWRDAGQQRVSVIAFGEPAVDGRAEQHAALATGLA